jgi:hypothetical protein
MTEVLRALTTSSVPPLPEVAAARVISAPARAAIDATRNAHARVP